MKKHTNKKEPMTIIDVATIENINSITNASKRIRNIFNFRVYDDGTDTMPNMNT